MAGQYWLERRRRRAFCRSLESPRSQPLAEQLAGTPAAAASGGNRVPALGGTGTPHQEPEPFPTFGRYFVDHLGHYGLAVLFVCLALLVRWWLEPALRGRVPYGFFLLAVVATALVADLWETLLALVVGFLTADYFFVPPPGFRISGADGWLGALIYWVTGLGIMWFMKSEHTAWLRTLDRDIAYVDRLKELDRERASHKLTQTDREILAGIVDSAQDAILSVTSQGRITTWNAAAERRFGFSAREAIGQPLALIVPPERRAEQERLLEQINRGQPTEQWHTVLSCKGGSSVEMSLVLSPLKGRSGAFIGASMIARDRSSKP
ncbi:MAG: PAS domain S-box protein [Verrucomicrobiota bacterium]|jgi:PAS domain S-box-containing protein